MSVGPTLAALNACLNGTCAVLLVFAWRAIRTGKRDRHRALMVTAFVVSCVFLVSYSTRMILVGDTHFGGEGALRIFYFGVLISHVVLAVVVVPLVLRTLYLAIRDRFEEHRRIARFTLPIWLYVSVTGVVVYVMLYRV